MALFETRWLFDEKHCCLLGEAAFPTAWIAPAEGAMLLVAGSPAASTALNQ